MTKNFAYSAISAGSAALMLALLTLVERLLGVSSLGAFYYAITVATLAEVLMDFGLHQITIRAIAQRPDRAGSLLATSLVVKAVPGVVMVVVGTIAVWVLRAEADVRTASFIMLLSAAMRSYLLTARGIIQGLERFGDDALVTMADRLLLAVACSIALFAGADVVGVSIVFLATRVVSAIGAVALARARAGSGDFDRGLVHSMVKEALPVGFFLLVLNLYNRVDTLMLGSIMGDEATGRYGTAYSVYEGLTYATAVVSSVLTPRLSSLWHGDRLAYRALVRQSLLGTVALALAIGGAAWGLAGIAIEILFGPDSASSAMTLRLLLLGLPFIYVIWVLHAVALSSHLTTALVRVTAIGVTINIGLNIWLIPFYAENGAAVSTAVSEGIVMVLLFVALRAARTNSDSKIIGS